MSNTLKLYTQVVIPVMDLNIRSLCIEPYPNHPKGCPNYGQRDICPPKSKCLHEVLDMGRGILAVWARFDLGTHVKKMRKAHLHWSYRQLSCCLYWQGTVRKALRPYAAAAAESYEALLVTCPEAMGVNVTATMKNIGIELEWPPKKFTRMIYLIGVKK